MAASPRSMMPARRLRPSMKGGHERIAARMFDTVHDGVIVTDKHRRIIEVNRAFTETSGFRREALIGRTPAVLRSGAHDAAFYERMWSQIRDAGTWRGELVNRRADGGFTTELATISAVRDLAGEVSHYVATYADLTLVKAYQQRLEYLAYHDSLTRLPNRELFSDRMEQALARAQRHDTLLAVGYLDLDGFKPINDGHGHHAGDRVLREIADRLQANLRGEDTVARLGGDEFALLLTNVASIRELETALDRLLAVLAEPIAGFERVQLSASIGVSLYPADGEDADTLLRQADQAMYRAKENGRNQWQLFRAPDESDAQRRKDLSRDIGTALTRGELSIHYQPIISIEKAEVVGCEALIRWHHPRLGMLKPASFLPAIQDARSARKIDNWVIDAVLSQLSAWRREGIALPVSINVSAALLQQEDLGSHLSERLSRHPSVSPDQIQLEILETAALQDLARASRIIDDCSARGFRFALDDFGTGYSSLTYCRRLAVQTLKIDRSFVAGMLDDPEDRAIVEGVIGLARAFRRRAVAEGVESTEQMAALKRLDCDHVQGYGIAPPLSPDDFVGWLATGAWHCPRADAADARPALTPPTSA